MAVVINEFEVVPAQAGSPAAAQPQAPEPTAGAQSAASQRETIEHTIRRRAERAARLVAD